MHMMSVNDFVHIVKDGLHFGVQGCEIDLLSSFHKAIGKCPMGCWGRPPLTKRLEGARPHDTITEAAHCGDLCIEDIHHILEPIPFPVTKLGEQRLRQVAWSL